MAYEAGVGGEEFWEMTPADINRKIEAYNNKERAEWERARLISFYSIMPHLDSKKDNSMTSIVPMPWDKKPKSKNRKLSEADKKWLESQKIKFQNGTI